MAGKKGSGPSPSPRREPYKWNHSPINRSYTDEGVGFVKTVGPWPYIAPHDREQVREWGGQRMALGHMATHVTK
jgi:hypothetical protein